MQTYQTYINVMFVFITVIAVLLLSMVALTLAIRKGTQSKTLKSLGKLLQVSDCAFPWSRDGQWVRAGRKLYHGSLAESPSYWSCKRQPVKLKNSPEERLGPM